MTKAWSPEMEALVQRDSAQTLPLMLLLRHADRGPMPDGEPGNEVPLLPTGVERALAFGQRLGSDLISVHTSPVLRCVQTAEALVQGAGVTLPIIPDQHLGDPGVYVIDGEIAWEAWQAMGHERVVATIMEGAQLPGLADPILATRELLRWMRDMSGGRVGVHVFVTHDLLVTAAAAHCLGQLLAIDQWPDFLEGLALHDEGGRVSASYRGLSSTVERF